MTWGILLNAFFLSQFSYCSLVWTLFSHGKNNMINWLLEKYLGIVYRVKKFTFIELVEKDNSVSILHKQNLHSLFIKVFKFKRCKTHALFKVMISQTRKNRYEL